MGGTHIASGSGNGGFDAFVDAINKVMQQHNYTLPALADFEIRIPRGGHTSALTECVITWNCGDELRKTRAVHSNQVFAAVLAALKIINMQLHELGFSQT
jgi:D-citramalate synthase